MSGDEQPLADATGRFARVVVDGQKVPDVEWNPGRILLSNERLLLVGEDDRESVALSAVTGVKSRRGSGADQAGTGRYVAVQAGADATLVAPATNRDAFERSLYEAVLDGQVILARHPAVEGGVRQDADWRKGRVAVDGESVGLALGDGRFVEIEIGDVGRVTDHEDEVEGDERLVLAVEHGEAGTAVETHVTGARRHVAILGSLFARGEQRNAVDVDLDPAEMEVLLALYSGVSPFQLPTFVGMDVDRVEAIYDDLLEAGLLEEIRTRRDVSLKPRGRSIAGEAAE